MDLTNHLKVADHAVGLAQKLIDKLGPLSADNGTLRAGEHILNGDVNIVNKVYESTLFGCTIFAGNVRIATRAIAKGKTEVALGTQANDEVTQLVWGRGETFRGTTVTLEKEWVIVYRPLHCAEGKRVGMLAAYRELKPYS